MSDVISTEGLGLPVEVGARSEHECFVDELPRLHRGSEAADQEFGDDSETDTGECLPCGADRDGSGSEEVIAASMDYRALSFGSWEEIDLCRADFFFTERLLDGTAAEYGFRASQQRPAAGLLVAGGLF